jgi:hypothetical protein
MNGQQVTMTGKEKGCKICGKVLKHQGALNIHMYHCKIKHGQHETVQKHFQQVTCEHEWRLLGKHHPAERQALAQGYNEVCSKCQEVQ